MKLRHLLWMGTTAYLTYKIVQNRHSLKQEVLDAQALTADIQRHLQDIKNNAQIITKQVPKLADMTTDLTYKTQVFQKEVMARTEQMPLLQEKTSP